MLLSSVRKMYTGELLICNTVLRAQCATWAFIDATHSDVMREVSGVRGCSNKVNSTDGLLIGTKRHRRMVITAPAAELSCEKATGTVLPTECGLFL